MTTRLPSTSDEQRPTATEVDLSGPFAGAHRTLQYRSSVDLSLAWLLRGSSIVLLGYFTLSHWFFPRFFFEALGIRGEILASPFLHSQLRLIGAMVAGYSVILAVVSRDIDRYRAILVCVLLVGVMCIAVFLGEVLLGNLPRAFLVNAALLAFQWIAVVALLTLRRRPSS